MSGSGLTRYVDGQGVAAASNLNALAQTCDTVADLRVFVGSASIQVYARGTVSVGDGGGGWFRWDGAATSTDDGVNIIVPFAASTGAWLRLVSSGAFGIQTSQPGAPIFDIGAIGTNNVYVTGSGISITSLGASATTLNPVFLLTFEGVDTIVASSSILTPGASNITTSAKAVYLVQLFSPGIYIVTPFTGAGGGGGGAGSIPVVGALRNGSMSVTAAAATATFGADEVVVQTALGGTSYTLSSYMQAVNLATTGAGGMDAGAAPVGSFVCLYAVYNPTGPTTSILACAVGTSSGSVYTGGNMPAGYTASALISVWPTNASRQFIIAYQVDRKVWFPKTQIGGALGAGSYTSLSVASAVPTNAKTCSGVMGNASYSEVNFCLAASAAGMAETMFAGVATAVSGVVDGFGCCGGFFDMPIVTAQTLFYKASVAGAARLDINAYTF